MSKIAIIGAGPSGMMAAHAASQCGAYVDIFDADPSQSRRNSGVYFLHDECDLLLGQHTRIYQTVLGIYGMSPEEIGEAYGSKVYGQPIAKTSVLEAAKHPTINGYNAGEAINRLWDLYGGQVSILKIESFEHLISLFDKYDKIISTIPANILFPDFEYESVQTWIKVGKAPEEEAFLFYNINPHCSWYRCSGMFGIFIQEYGFKYIPFENKKYSFKEVTKIIGARKTMYHQSNAHLEDGKVISDVAELFLVGRYGAWSKKTLTHNVYYETLDWLTKSG